MSLSQRQRRPFLLRSTALVAAAWLGARDAQAADIRWNVTDGAWGSAASWQGATVPGAADTATFDGPSASATVDLGGVTNPIGGLTFNNTTGAGYSFGSGILSFSANAVVNSSGPVALGGYPRFLSSATLVLTGSTTFSIGAGVDIGLSIEGLVTGSAPLIKVGTGTLRLTNGASDYSGATLVSGGTLEASASSALSPNSDFTVAAGAFLSIPTGDQEIGSLAGEGIVNIASGASLTTGLNERTTTFSGAFIGAGDVTIDGPGTRMTLTGNSSIGGDLTVCCALLDIQGAFRAGGTAAALGGELKVSGLGGNLVADMVGVEGGDITVTDGGRIGTNLLASIVGDISVSGNGSRIDAGQIDLTTLAGDASLTVSDGGQVFTSADASLSSAVLGDASATVQGEGSEWIADGTITVGATYGGIPTAGLLTVSDGGRVSAGSLIIGEEGAVQVGTGSAGGTIEASSLINRGTLTFNHTDALAFDAPMSGTGTLIKRGSGRLDLAGIHSFSGSTQVQAGNLAVNGSLASSAVTVMSGATLSGTGTVGSTTAQSGATVAPGNSIGTLNVAGNISFARGSFYALEINGAGQSDRIAATGKATLSGGTVQILPDPGTGYAADVPYTILTARGGVSGAFQGTTGGDFAFVTPTLGYRSDAVTLTLVRKVVPPTPPNPPAPPTPVAFNSVAVTKNQYNSATALEMLGSGNRLFDAVLMTSIPGARQAFDALSGEIHASAATSAYGDAALVQDTLLNRLRTGPAVSAGQASGTYNAAYASDTRGRAQHPVAITPGLDPRRFALWGEGFGSWGRLRSNGNAAPLDTSTGGFILGAEANLDRDSRIGIAGGFTRTTFDAKARLSSGSNESVFGALYGSTALGAMTLRAGAAYAGHDIDASRAVMFPGFADAVSASYDGSTVQAFGEVGYRFAWGSTTLEPFVGSSVIRLHTGSFVESGGAAALTGYARTYDLGTATLGLRAETRIGNDMPLTLRGMLGWRIAAGDVEPAALLAFAGGASPFAVAGVPVDRNALVAEAGLDWQASDAISLGVAYTGQIGSRAQDHALKANFTWRFGTR